MSASTVLMVQLSPAPVAASAAVVVNTRTSGAMPLPIARYVTPTQVGRTPLARMGIALPRSRKHASAASQAIPMLYQGGPVLHSVKVYVDFWGTEWRDTNQGAVMGFITGFYTHLGGSPWAGIMGQYCSGIAINSSSCPPGANLILNPAGQLKGQYIDITRTVPASPTFADMQTEATTAATYFGDPTGALFMIYTPSGKSEAGFGTDFCAYHSFVNANMTQIPFGYMPYQPDANGGCGSGLNGFSIVAGHEYAEAVTDPVPSSTPGWTG